MNTNSNLSLPNHLAIPLPYLLQKYSATHICSYQDDNGWSFLHWSVAKKDLPKTLEILSVGCDYNLKTSNNVIPDELFVYPDKKVISDKLHNNNILFSIGGCSPIHLCAYFHHFYMKGFHKTDSHQFNKCMDEQEVIFNSLIEHNKAMLFLRDNSNMTVTDYCFLLEDWDLLNIILKNDTTFESLHELHTCTAISICEIYKKNLGIKTTSAKTNNIILNIINILERKKNYQDLDKALPVQDCEKKIKRQKV